MWFPVTPGPENRWEWTPADERHVLVLQGGIAVEVDGEWAHMYSLGGGPLFRAKQEGDPPGDLMANLQWMATVDHAAIAAFTDDDLWVFMETSAQNQEFSPITPAE